LGVSTLAEKAAWSGHPFVFTLQLVIQDMAS